MHYHRVFFEFENTNRVEPAELGVVDSYIHEHCGDLQFICWSLDDAKAFLEKEYPFMLDVFLLSLPKPIVLCDLFRYVLMYHFGGVYTDIDFLPIRSFDTLMQHLQSDAIMYSPRRVRSPTVVLSEEWLNSSTMTETIHNGILISLVPRHPFWMKLMMEVYLGIRAGGMNVGSDADVYSMSGPKRLCTYYKENFGLFDDVCLLPHFYFCPYISYEENSEGKVVAKVCGTHTLQSETLPNKKAQWVFLNIRDHASLQHLCPNSFFVNVFMNTGSMWKK